MKKKNKKLEERLKTLEKELLTSGSYFYPSTKDTINDNTRNLRTVESQLNKLILRVESLESIIRESGIVEDIDLSDVKYRTETSIDYGTYQVKTEQIPYVINQVKVK